MVRSTRTVLKQRILEEARQVLEAEGVNALSTRRLAKAVGCTATSLYIYFDNKEALLHVLMEEGFEKLGEELKACTATTSPAERPRALANTYLNFGLNHPAWYELMFLLPAERLGSPYPPEKYRQGRRYLERLSEALTGDIDSSLAGEQTLIQATLLWSHLHGLLSLILAGRVDASLDRQTLIDAALDRALPSPNAKGATRAPGSVDLPS